MRTMQLIVPRIQTDSNGSMHLAPPSLAENRVCLRGHDTYAYAQPAMPLATLGLGTVPPVIAVRSSASTAAVCSRIPSGSLHSAPAPHVSLMAIGHNSSDSNKQNLYPAAL